MVETIEVAKSGGITLNYLFGLIERDGMVYVVTKNKKYLMVEVLQP